MLELSSLAELRRWRREQHEARRRVGLVPTMGYLHEGHLRLVDEARRRADTTVMSIFVNPLQFGAGEDLDRYPRDLPRDRALAAGRGVDLLLVPDAATMYPPGTETRIVPGDVAARWEGAVRPGHFAGVLTVVAKLLHLVEPDVVCFGRKDLQQATLVRAMLRDLDWPTEMVVVPTARDADGLALSSRNAYLSPAQRREALALSAALGAAHEAWRAGERSAAAIHDRMRAVLELQPGVRVEYIAIAEPERLEPVSVAEPTTTVAIAARVGPTRLIDNIIIGEGLG